MATAIDQGGEFAWPPGLAVYDPAEWDCRAAWHLARARACQDHAVKLVEIQTATARPWLDDGPVGELGGVAFVLAPDAG
jgi:hypothetical protein